MPLQSPTVSRPPGDKQPVTLVGTTKKKKQLETSCIASLNKCSNFMSKLPELSLSNTWTFYL